MNTVLCESLHAASDLSTRIKVYNGTLLMLTKNICLFVPLPAYEFPLRLRVLFEAQG
jgi:hypothetical protein